MAAPRTKALSTRLLLLVEVHNRRHTRLRTLAERLDVTVQAVSDYVKRLSNDGVIENVGGAWKPTKKGTALLHDSMRDLREFLDGAEQHLRMIEDTLALADRRLRAEQDVGLYMKDGRLCAGSSRGKTSRGRTRTGADAGQLVLVGDLKGLLELAPATVTVLGHPDFPTGPALDRAKRHLARARGHPGRTLLAAHELASVAWIAAIGAEPDLEFAPLEASDAAARRGVPVLYFVPEARAAEVEARLRGREGAAEPLPVRRVDL